MAACGLTALGLAAAESPSAEPFASWETYNGQISGEHYSTLDQINRENVGQVRMAWSYNLGETGARFEGNPIVIGRVLYAFTPSLKVIALDAATGTLVWKFDSGFKSEGPIRGLSYWTDGQSGRLFAGITHYLYAIDPSNGRQIESFGRHGRIDLRQGLRGDFRRHFVQITSPGVVFEDRIIVGFRTLETAPAPPGDIRAYDVHSGKLRWRFHTIPHPGEFGYATWPKDAWRSAGAANNWAGMVIDQQRGIVYAPTGSAVSDFYGANRIGDDLFADTLLALDARTGKRLWHFQGVHHDLWDRDFSSPPVLVTVHRDGKVIDAVAQPTKQGFLFLLDRTSGAPLFPIEERSYPASDVPGESASRTQPYPTVPEPFARQQLTEDILTIRTPEVHAWAVDQFRTFISKGQFVPLSLDRQTVIFPGFDGGAEWGGPAVNPDTGVLYINSNDIAWTGGLARIKLSEDPAEAFYQQNCLACHGPNRTGSPPAFPSLVNITKRRSLDQVRAAIRQGKGRMPAFANLDGDGLSAVIEYISDGKTVQAATSSRPESPAEAASLPRQFRDQNGIYEFTGYRKFLDPDGYPAVSPPWGTLSAINLNTGRYLWQIPLGEYPELQAKGYATTGSENYGGPIVTSGGLVIIGATIFDKKLRFFDSDSGELLKEIALPFAGTATPASYGQDGKQYIVIGTSGSRDAKGPQGAAYVAFSLP